jgi:hypothetical protein
VCHFLYQSDVTGPLVSMVDGELFDKLAAIGGRIRSKPYEPFGGIQVHIDCSVLVVLAN